MFKIQNTIKYTTYILLTLCISNVISMKLSKNYKRCNLKSPYINDCINRSLNQSFPDIAKGVPSLGLFPLDPLFIPSIDIKQGGNRIVSVDMKFRDVNITNLLSTVLRDVHVDVNNNNVSMKFMMTKTIVMESYYDLIGKVFGSPISGKGTCRFDFEKIKSSVKIQFQRTVKNNRHYLVPQNVNYVFTTSRIYINFDNLFNGDKNLENTMNVFLNENWRELSSDIQSVMEEAINSIIYGYISRFFGEVPMDEIFVNHL
ncbi:protein takeout-like [Daktulosphaira vitifoliae]|uniref:protein takeout-like n=1 Tax=Daktulosphaira vitifoliae TaxID=58002 RepID=UPI0021AA6878|nr:protein takeout-like [Daktulosphaira vitifoliae]